MLSGYASHPQPRPTLRVLVSLLIAQLFGAELDILPPVHLVDLVLRHAGADEPGLVAYHRRRGLAKKGEERRERLTERDEVAGVREALHDGLDGREVEVVVAVASEDHQQSFTINVGSYNSLVMRDKDAVATWQIIHLARALPIPLRTRVGGRSSRATKDGIKKQLGAPRLPLPPPFQRDLDKRPGVAQPSA